MNFARGDRDQQNCRQRLRVFGRKSGGRQYACEALEERRLLSVSPTSDPGVAALAQSGARVYTTGASPQATGSSSVVGFTPTQIQHAYGFDQIKFLNGTVQGDGSGQTVAIIEAYDDPNIASDVAGFSTQFGLPQFNVTGGPTFKKVSQTGGSTSGIGVDPSGGFTLETSLDVEWVHAIAPKANILLVEAMDTSFSNLVNGAVAWAQLQPGVSVVSMSFGAAEWSGETGLDTAFTTPGGHTGISYFASTGDSGTGLYPAFSPNVVAVGGTSLTLDSSNNIISETVWNNQYGSTGGGLSSFEGQPSYQVSLGQPTRATPDVAFDGDPATGVAVYDSTDYGASTPWVKVGGTSFSAPAWGALTAIADQGRHLAGLTPLDSPTLLSKLYSLPSTDFHDITSGSVGTNLATTGYDLVSGLGTPIANLVVSGLIGSSSIGGTVFSDTNGNGSQDGSEAGLSGWTVYQDSNNNGSYDAPANTAFTAGATSIGGHATIASTISVSSQSSNIVHVSVTANTSFSQTDSSLAFTLISPNNSQIQLVPATIGNGNFTATFDDSAAVAIATAGTGAISGTYQPTTALALLDGTNGAGAWKLQITNGSSRSGTLNSWTLSLSSGDPSTTSNSSGVYQFTNLPAATYKVGEVVQAPYTETAPVASFYNVNLGANSNLTGQNFGNLPPASVAPTGVALQAVSDTGSSSSDGITNINHALQFLVSGTVSGAAVAVYVDGNQVGSAVASGASTIVTTSVGTILSDGPHSVTARQTLPSHALSPSSPALAITIDTTVPSATITAVSPNPSTTSIGQMTITFSESVSGLMLSDLQLTRNGGSNLLSGAQTISSSDGGTTWILNNLSAVTNVGGSYQLTLNPTVSPISDLAGNTDVTTMSSNFVVDLAAPVVDLNGPAAGTSYTSIWTNHGPVNTTDVANATITDADSPNLSSIWILLPDVVGGDVIGYNTAGTSITAFPASGTVLLSGSDTVAHYQQVLRTITYTNSIGGPNVPSEPITFQVSDGTLSSRRDQRHDLDGPQCAGRRSQRRRRRHRFQYHLDVVGRHARQHYRSHGHHQRFRQHELERRLGRAGRAAGWRCLVGEHERHGDHGQLRRHHAAAQRHRHQGRLSAGVAIGHVQHDGARASHRDDQRCGR